MIGLVDQSTRVQGNLYRLINATDRGHANPVAADDNVSFRVRFHVFYHSPRGE